MMLSDCADLQHAGCGRPTCLRQLQECEAAALLRLLLGPALVTVVGGGRCRY